MEGEANSKLPPPGVGAKIESSTCPEELPNPRKKKYKSRKRFSDEQIRSLESIFKSETKLEPRKKLQVARELGLQPRQVAIWFQNRRARWKSKEIEQSYRVLRANYENLHSRFESLKKEKQSLHTQLQNLRDLLEKRLDRGCNKDLGGNSTPCGTDGDTHHDLKAKRSFFNDGSGREVTYLDDEEGGNAELFLQEEAELLNMDGKVDGSMAWYNFDSKAIFDQSSRSSNWWDSWT